MEEQIKNQETVEMDYLVMTRKELNSICNRAASIGAKTALEKWESEKKSIKAKMMDKRLHNTKLLLRNYRMLRENVGNSIYDRMQMKESAADILYGMMNLYDDDVIVDSIKRTTTRTAIILSHIDTMISLYETYCGKSSDELDRRRFEVLYDRYIADKNLTVKQIANKQNMSMENVYSDLKIATERMSALIFGIDGLKID